MLCIPYLARAGVVSLKFRRLGDGDGPKYISNGYAPRLYNVLALDRADRTGQLGICEGELDALILDRYCGIPAVGIPGVDTYKASPAWREVLRGYREVLIFKDNDDINPKTNVRPGSELARQLVRDIDTARIVRLPCRDVNDTFLERGREGIREAAGLV